MPKLTRTATMSVLFLSAAIVYAGGQRLMSTISQPIRSEAEAIARALTLTGFEGSLADAASAHRLVLAQDQTPFLASQLNGKVVWQVQFKVNAMKWASQPP